MTEEMGSEKKKGGVCKERRPLNEELNERVSRKHPDVGSDRK